MDIFDRSERQAEPTSTSNGSDSLREEFLRDLHVRAARRALGVLGNAVSETGLMRQAASGTWRTALGGTGILNNAGTTESPTLQRLQQARTIGFLLDSSRTIFRVYRPGSAAPLINLRPGSPLEMVNRVSNSLLRGSEPLFPFFVARDVRNEWNRVQGNNNGPQVEQGLPGLHR